MLTFLRKSSSVIPTLLHAPKNKKTEAYYKLKGDTWYPLEIWSQFLPIVYNSPDLFIAFHQMFVNHQSPAKSFPPTSFLSSKTAMDPLVLTIPPFTGRETEAGTCQSWRQQMLWAWMFHRQVKLRSLRTGSGMLDLALGQREGQGHLLMSFPIPLSVVWRSTQLLWKQGPPISDTHVSYSLLVYVLPMFLFPQCFQCLWLGLWVEDSGNDTQRDPWARHSPRNVNTPNAWQWGSADMLLTPREVLGCPLAHFGAQRECQHGGQRLCHQEWPGLPGCERESCHGWEGVNFFLGGEGKELGVGQVGT